MRSEVEAGEPQVITAQQIADMGAMSKRSADTGEFYCYDPATREVEVYKPLESPRPVYSIHASDLRKAPSRPPLVHAPERRENEGARRDRRPAARRRARAPTGDDPSEPDLAVIPPSAFRAEVLRVLGGAA